jgi:hypothetical protein
MGNWLIWNQRSFSSLPSFDPVGFLLEPTGHQKLVIMVAMMTATTTPVDAGAAPAPEATNPGSGVPGAAPVGAGTEPAEGAAGAASERASIRIATYNIRSGRAGRLEMALRAMNQMNVDIGILMEAKLTDGIDLFCQFAFPAICPTPSCRIFVVVLENQVFVLAIAMHGRLSRAFQLVGFTLVSSCSGNMSVRWIPFLIGEPDVWVLARDPSPSRDQDEEVLGNLDGIDHDVEALVSMEPIRQWREVGELL